MDSVKKLCTSMRRNAKEERVLFHYNGHGVPRPTANGEVWVFNKSECRVTATSLPRHCRVTAASHKSEPFLSRADSPRARLNTLAM